MINNANFLVTALDIELVLWMDCNLR